MTTEMMQQAIHELLGYFNIALFAFTGTIAYIFWQTARRMNARSLEHEQFVCMGLALAALALYILFYGLR
jgi:hypothetical protein